MAEREGFEPPFGFHRKLFSRQPVSTTHTSLRVVDPYAYGSSCRLLYLHPAVPGDV